MNNKNFLKQLAFAGLLIAACASSARAENMTPVVGEVPYTNPPAANAPTIPNPTQSGMMPAPAPVPPSPPQPATQAAIPTPDVIGTSGLPQPERAGDIRFITGGIGDEERDALESVKNNYNVHVTNVNQTGEFLGDTQITILNRKGETVIQTTAGPMFYIDLPAGSYTVEALNGGQSQTKKINVGPQKKSSLYLRW